MVFVPTVGSCDVNVDMMTSVTTPNASPRGASIDVRGGRPGTPCCAYTHGVTEQQAELIAVDPDVVGGQAHVRGTRIPVSVVLDCLAAGLTEDKILGQYPSLTVEDIRAAAAYGASLAREEIIPLPA